MRPRFWPLFEGEPTPAPSRLVGHHYAALEEQILDVPQAPLEALVQPDGMADNCPGKPVALVEGLDGLHRRTLPPMFSALP